MTIDEYIVQCKNSKFEFGAFDCCLFAAGAVQCKTGTDPLEGMRDYNSEQSATIVLNENFGTLNIRDIFLEMARFFNAHTVGIEEAQNGDIVCIKWPRQFLQKHEIDQSCGLGVYYRNQILACSQRGLIPVPLGERIIDIWRF